MTSAGPISHHPVSSQTRSSTLLVRRSRPGDAAEVLSLLHQVGLYPDEKSYNETFAQVVRHPETAVFVAQEGNHIIGYLALCHRAQIHLSGRVATIDALVVEETRRGDGVGSALLSMAIQFASSLGCQAIEHQVPRGQESYLRGFHSGHGFGEIDTAAMRLLLQPLKSRV